MKVQLKVVKVAGGTDFVTVRYGDEEQTFTGEGAYDRAVQEALSYGKKIYISDSKILDRRVHWNLKGVPIGRS